jgi:hypothetical protein
MLEIDPMFVASHDRHVSSCKVMVTWTVGGGGRRGTKVSICTRAFRPFAEICSADLCVGKRKTKKLPFVFPILHTAPPVFMASFASRSSQALRAASRRVPRTAQPIKAASYSLLATRSSGMASAARRTTTSVEVRSFLRKFLIAQ